MNSFQSNLYGDWEIGEGTTIGAMCDIGGKIGKNCKIQTGVSIPPLTIIGDNVFSSTVNTQLQARLKVSGAYSSAASYFGAVDVSNSTTLHSCCASYTIDAFSFISSFSLRNISFCSFHFSRIV